MIEINELTKYYGESKAVGPLSFTIEKGEVVGLLGLNGAGKTTTLRMLSSELLPTSGQMTVDGVDLVEEPERVRPRIGYLPDRPPLYDEMTVREYLQFAAELRGMKGSRVAKRVASVVELTDLGDRLDDTIDTLSHGYRQRVGIAQSIVHEPQLLILDEPISGLDPVQIVEMRRLIISLRGEYTTVLSSHILSEISETCDRLLVIRDGEIIASGSEDQLRGAVPTSRHRVELETRVPTEGSGDAETLALELVTAIEGVESAEVTQCDEAKRLVRLTVVSDDDVRESLARQLVDAGYGLLAMNADSKELESVFIELTAHREKQTGGKKIAAAPEKRAGRKS